MKTGFGWTLLSREALKNAEAHLREHTQGVRDEVGFLALHQAYADRFFPGTSVLQTRLRYALFVPWIYERLLARPPAERADRAVEREEVQLAGRLKKSNAENIIGGRNYPEPTSQPPTLVYWTALGTWGILRPLLGQLPSRATIHQLLVRRREAHRQIDDDKQPLEQGKRPFGSIPQPPKDWDEVSKPLTFALAREERIYLKLLLSAVMRPGAGGSQSLLARLAERGTSVGKSPFPWVAAIQAEADAEDRAALERASKAAALSAIGRAVYAAMVEEIRESDGLETANTHREHLAAIVPTYKHAALALDPDQLAEDSPDLARASIVEILKSTQNWLRRGGNYLQLRDLYAKAESARKGGRARLPRTPSARRKRVEWTPDKHTLAAPIHYRWDKVTRLLGDLRGDS